MQKKYSYAIIGAGLIGSAAAKYIATNNNNVILIGPKEPEDKRNHNNRFWIKNKLSEDISGSDEEDEILYEEELEGNTYFISESIPKMIYEKLKNDEVGENIGSINNQGTIIWNKK